MSTQTDRAAGVNFFAAIKVPVVVATTANITLSGTQTIDGVAVVATNRVLVKDNTDTTENGVYVASATAWARAADFDGTGDVVTGTVIPVVSGTVGGSTFWYVSTSGDPNPGDAMAFGSFIRDATVPVPIASGGTGAITAAAALTALGAAQLAAINTFSAINTFTKAQVWAKGSDLTSAATLVIGTDGMYFDVAGNTGPITAMTVAAGRFFILQFDSTPTLTDSASLDLGGADITTAAGDVLYFFSTAANTAQLLNPPATQAIMEAAASRSYSVTPGNQHSHPSAAKAWGKIDGAGGGIDGTAYNIGTIDDDGAGSIGVNLSTAMSSVNYVAGATPFSTGEEDSCRIVAQVAGSFDVKCEGVNGGDIDPSDSYQVWAFGDQ